MFLRKSPPNVQLSIVVPDAAAVPAELAAVLDDTDHYIVEQVCVGEFVQRRFVEAFVKRGKWSVLSTGRFVRSPNSGLQ